MRRRGAGGGELLGAQFLFPEDFLDNGAFEDHEPVGAGESGGELGGDAAADVESGVLHIQIVAGRQAGNRDSDPWRGELTRVE